MPFFKRLTSRKSSSSPATNTVKMGKSNPFLRSPSTATAQQSPFAVITPTRRPVAAPDNDAPPAYSASPALPVQTAPVRVSEDSRYAFLAQFDTIFLIDDSGSMAGRSWRETSAALSAITPVCTAQDADGIDILFLNHRNHNARDNLGGYTSITTTSAVQEIFNVVRPMGGTPTGTRLNQILKPYLVRLEGAIKHQTSGQSIDLKPLNIIVITDGVATDDVESVIVSAAKKLDAYGAEPWQVGIQFFQVGQEADAAEDLRELDDALSETHGIRDMVDTVPWTGEDGATLSADGILKVTLGAIVKKLDRRRGSDERLRK